MTAVLRFILTGTGLGKIPQAPGTWGSLWGIPLVWALSQGSDIFYLGFTFLLIIFGIYAIDYAYQFGANEDPKEIVWDEILGYAVSMALLPGELFYYVAAFALFRFFDIVKPYPISYLDKNLKGGMGVMLDDALAGIFTNLILHLVWFYWGENIHAIF